MSLETRVETLEHELKILKNEIEHTLLEIQNQVLIHYYPSLRAEDAAPPKELLPLLESAFTEGDEPATPLAKPRPEDEAPAPPPKAKEVSLTDIKRKPKPIPSLPVREPSAAKTETKPAKVTMTPAKVAAAPAPIATLVGPEETIPQELLPLLAKWVNESVEKIGKELAQNMVESAANTEQITPEVMTLLLEFITLCEEEHPPEAIGTKELMDVLLKLDKMLGQVSKLLEHTADVNEEHNG